VDRNKKLRRKHEQGEETTFELPVVNQKNTDNEIRNRKANSHIEDRIEFLKSIIDELVFIWVFINHSFNRLIRKSITFMKSYRKTR